MFSETSGPVPVELKQDAEIYGEIQLGGSPWNSLSFSENVVKFELHNTDEFERILMRLRSL